MIFLSKRVIFRFGGRRLSPPVANAAAVVDADHHHVACGGHVG